MVSIYGLKKGWVSGTTPASQSEHLCRTNANLSDDGIARYPLARVRIRGEIFFCENFEKPPLQLPKTGLFHVQYYNRAGAKISPRCGLKRSWADIETEAFYPVVYYGRNKRKRLWAMKSNHPKRISCRRDGDCSGAKFVVKIVFSLFRNKGYS